MAWSMVSGGMTHHPDLYSWPHAPLQLTHQRQSNPLKFRFDPQYEPHGDFTAWLVAV